MKSSTIKIILILFFISIFSFIIFLERLHITHLTLIPKYVFKEKQEKVLLFEDTMKNGLRDRSFDITKDGNFIYVVDGAEEYLHEIDITEVNLETKEVRAIYLQGYNYQETYPFAAILSSPSSDKIYIEFREWNYENPKSKIVKINNKGQILEEYDSKDGLMPDTSHVRRTDTGLVAGNLTLQYFEGFAPFANFACEKYAGSILYTDNVYYISKENCVQGITLGSFPESFNFTQKITFIEGGNIYMLEGK